MSQKLSLEAFVACRSRSMPQFLLFLTTLWHDSIAYDARDERKEGKREGKREGKEGRPRGRPLEVFCLAFE